LCPPSHPVRSPSRAADRAAVLTESLVETSSSEDEPTNVEVRWRPHDGDEVTGSFDEFDALNARYRRAVKARGHSPTKQAALKCLYLVTRSLDPTGKGRTRWAMRWKPASNAFAITFAGRIVPSNGN
jgi:hypothetical protein